MAEIQLTQRQRVVLAGLAGAGGAEYAPVQVQKLFFLLDENVSPRYGAKLFNFQPYDYGPFDSAVYSELSALERLGLVRVDSPSAAGRRRYSLTPAGQTAGEAELKRFTPDVSDYVAKTAQWVRSLSFAQLVGSIYNAYPQMRVNSIFRG